MLAGIDPSNVGHHGKYYDGDQRAVSLNAGDINDRGSMQPRRSRRDDLGVVGQHYTVIQLQCSRGDLRRADVIFGCVNHTWPYPTLQCSRGDLAAVTPT